MPRVLSHDPGPVQCAAQLEAGARCTRAAGMAVRLAACDRGQGLLALVCTTCWEHARALHGTPVLDPGAPVQRVYGC